MIGSVNPTPTPDPQTLFTGRREGTPSWYSGTKLLTAGILKIGAMTKGPKGPRPEKLDHFRYCSSSVDREGVYPDHPDFVAENTANLSSVPVQFYTDDDTLNVEFGWILMKGGATVCRGLGNGDLAPERRPGFDVAKPFEKLNQECGETCPYAKNGACKRASVARLVVPGRNSRGQLHTPLNSVWQFRSHGDNTAQLLMNAMRDFKALTGGILAGIPLLLTVQRETRRGLAAFWSVGLTFDGLPSDLDEAVMREFQRRDRFDQFQQSRAIKSVTMEDLLRSQGRTIGFEDSSASFAINAEFSPSTLNGAVVQSANLPNEAVVADLAVAPAGSALVEITAPEVEAGEAEPAQASPGVPTAPVPCGFILPERAPNEKGVSGPQLAFIETLGSRAGIPAAKIKSLLLGLGLDQAKAVITFLKAQPDNAREYFAA